MNKKALMETFNVLIAVAVIATAFLIFYAWYSTIPADIGGKINERTANLKESNTLIMLLNTPAGDQQTIADLIVSGKTSEAALQIKSALTAIYGPQLKYELKLDDKTIAETDGAPSAPVSQEVFIPRLDYTVSKIVLEFGI